MGCNDCGSNCCLDSCISLYPVDCVKLYNAKDLFSFFDDPEGGVGVEHEGNYFAWITFDFFKKDSLRGLVKAPCTFLKDSLCGIHLNNINPSLLKFFSNEGISSRLKPFICRAYPLLQSNFFNGLVPNTSVGGRCSLDKSCFSSSDKLSFDKENYLNSVLDQKIYSLMRDGYSITDVLDFVSKSFFA